MSMNIDSKYTSPIDTSASKQGLKATTENATLSFQESMEEFKERALNQIKNGEPTYQIGGSELSIKEWDKLMSKVDKDIEAIKEEQKERLEKEEAERKLQEMLGTDAPVEGAIAETDTTVDESTIDKLFSSTLPL